MGLGWLKKELWPGNPAGGDVHIFRRRPDWIPQPFWQKLTRTRHACIAIWLCCGAATLVLLLSDINPEPYFPALSGFLVLIAAAWAIMPRVTAARFKRQLATHDNLLCLRCGYSLQGLPSEHTCPECGSAFNADEIREIWQTWVKTGRLPPKASPSSSSGSA